LEETAENPRRKAAMKTKKLQDEIVSNMRRWQGIENASVASTGQVIGATENPIVRLIMEIIQNDSQMHYRVQGLIADSLERTTISLTPDELGEVWRLIEEHIKIEKKTLKLAREALAALKGKKMLVQEYLLKYLEEDEKKHNRLLSSLKKIKDGMYPYG
jgi:hypothetical protein